MDLGGLVRMEESGFAPVFADDRDVALSRRMRE